MVKVLFFVIGLLLISSNNSYAQVQPECLNLMYGINPDSVLWDTCRQSPTYGQMYAHRGHYVLFNQNAITLPWFRHDTIVEVTWEAIDTNLKELREAFRKVSELFGPCVLRKVYPDDTSGSADSRIFAVVFTKLLLVDSVAASLNSIPYIVYWFLKPEVENGIQSAQSIPVAVFPNPSLGLFFVRGNGNGNLDNVVLTNSQGKEMPCKVIHQSHDYFVIDGRELTPGLYYVRLSKSTILHLMKY